VDGQHLFYIQPGPPSKGGNHCPAINYPAKNYFVEPMIAVEKLNRQRQSNVPLVPIKKSESLFCGVGKELAIAVTGRCSVGFCSDAGLDDVL